MAVTNNNFAMTGEKYDVKHFPMVPFIDAPVWPPIAFVETYEEEVKGGFDQGKPARKVKKKKLAVRGIWEPTIVDMRGGVIPPYMERVR